MRKCIKKKRGISWQINRAKGVKQKREKTIRLLIKKTEEGLQKKAPKEKKTLKKMNGVGLDEPEEKISPLFYTQNI